MALRLNTFKIVNNFRCICTSKFRFDTIAVYEQDNKPTFSGLNNKSIRTDSPCDNVPGLSKAVCDFGNEPVGPGASKNAEYKNPEYFSYHQLSFFEAEIEMMKYRLPQPSSTPK